MADEIPKIDIEITSIPINAKKRKLKGKLCNPNDIEENSLNNKPKDFVVYHHAIPKKETSFCSTSIEVLPELIGLEWNEVTMCYVLGLNPSAVRVSYDMVTLDSCANRITVMLDENDKITSITMEIYMPAPNQMCGYDMQCYLQAMRDGKTKEFKSIHQQQKENGGQSIQIGPGCWIGPSEVIDLSDLKDIKEI
jgi:hypothetical protein